MIEVMLILIFGALVMVLIVLNSINELLADQPWKRMVQERAEMKARQEIHFPPAG